MTHYLVPRVRSGCSTCDRLIVECCMTMGIGQDGFRAGSHSDRVPGHVVVRCSIPAPVATPLPSGIGLVRVFAAEMALLSLTSCGFCRQRSSTPLTISSIERPHMCLGLTFNSFRLFTSPAQCRSPTRLPVRGQCLFDARLATALVGHGAKQAQCAYPLGTVANHAHKSLLPACSYIRSHRSWQNATIWLRSRRKRYQHLSMLSMSDPA